MKKEKTPGLSKRRSVQLFSTIKLQQEDLKEMVSKSPEKTRINANNPEEFIAQMEDIANERFKENFPAAMNQFGRDLKRYQMNHSF